jgi:dTDP-glucose 4,6-dehydratase
VYRLISSDFKSKKLLNWKPEYKGVSGFKRGLEETIQWFSKDANLKYYKSNIYNI